MSIVNIKDWVQQNYGNVTMDVRKADDPLETGDTGMNNVIYGAYAFYQYNTVANTLGALPKFGRTSSGWRVNTSMAGSSGDGGVAESGAIPDSDHDSISELSAYPKEIVHRFDVSTRELLVTGKDDNWGNRDLWRKANATRHAKRMNEQLQDDVTNLASNDLESVDRVTSSYAEVTNCGDVDANDSDMYGEDRDAGATYLDANVDHNSNTDRSFKLDLMKGLKTDCVGYGGTPTMWITGPETVQQIENKVESQMRYAPLAYTQGKARVSANGLSTDGQDAGFEIAYLYGLPIISDNDVTTDGAPRIYCLDTSVEAGVPRLGVGFSAPTRLLTSANPLVNDYLYEKEAYYTAAELLCAVFRYQGKIRDLSA